MLVMTTCLYFVANIYTSHIYTGEYSKQKYGSWARVTSSFHGGISNWQLLSVV